jgi:hypothetical protein
MDIHRDTAYGLPTSWVPCRSSGFPNKKFREPLRCRVGFKCRLFILIFYYKYLGLIRESLFEILARSETRFLDTKFSRDFRMARESKLVARIASHESHRQKFHNENREKQVLLRNFVAKIASYEPRRKKFHRKISFSRVSQTNFVARLARITNFNSGVLRESCEKF